MANKIMTDFDGYILRNKNFQGGFSYAAYDTEKKFKVVVWKNFVTWFSFDKEEYLYKTRLQNMKLYKFIKIET